MNVVLNIAWGAIFLARMFVGGLIYALCVALFVVVVTVLIVLKSLHHLWNTIIRSLKSKQQEPN